ncbi:MAG: putative esterase [Polyangiales bacterium]|jgi:predicted esterase
MARFTLVALVLALACGDDSSLPIQDGGVSDVGNDATFDVGTDAGVVALDAGPDVPAEPDAGPVILTPRIPEPDGLCPDFMTNGARVGGLSVNFVAGAPTDIPGPLLIAWHGTGGSGRQIIQGIPQSIRDSIVAQGGLFLAPSDDGNTREGATTNGVWYEGSDLRMADQLIACAVRDHNIDPARIHVTGCSAGGLMAGAMTASRSSYVASSLLESGGLLGDRLLENPNYAPAVITNHGGDRDVVVIPFAFTSGVLNDLIVENGGFAVECNHGIGHCRSPAALLERGWDFLEAHPYGTSRPYAEGLPESFPDYCAIWPR